MRQMRVRSNRRWPARPRCREDSDGSDDPHRLGERLLTGPHSEVRDRRAERIHGIGERERVAQLADAIERGLSRFAERLAERRSLGWLRKSTTEEQEHRVLEGDATRDVLHGMARKDELALLAVDIAQPRRRGHHVFEPIRFDPSRHDVLQYIDQLDSTRSTLINVDNVDQDGIMDS
jgi:hypothetical protein